MTYLCAKYHLTREETDRIDVATFGGGRSITRKYFSGRVVNYYALNDPLVLIDKRANQLARQANASSARSATASTTPPSCSSRGARATLF